MPNINKIIIKSVSDKISPNADYSSDSFNYFPQFSGKNIKISILDTGTPKHKSIKNTLNNNVNFTKDKDLIDSIGHATMISGILLGKDKNITGISKDAEYYFAKIIDSNYASKSDSVVAGILWSIIKKVDVILIPIASNIDHQSLEGAIQKANKNNICIISAAGEEATADIDQVLKVGCKDSDDNIVSIPGKINVLGTGLKTTYLEDKFCLASGTSLSASLVAGLCANAIEKNRSENKQYTVESIYKEIADFQKT